MKEKKQGGWFRPRSYKHLDFPITYAAAQRLVRDPAEVGKRQFLPLIGYNDERRRFKTDNSDRTIPRKKRKKIVTVKKREIKFASHGDSAVYQRYAYLLDEPYEKFLADNGLDEVVIGYRSGKGSNVDMAASAFSEIVVRGETSAICMDIKDFFPSISHKILKSRLQTVLGQRTLSADWYAIFRSITKFSWIDSEALARLEGYDPKRPPFPLVSDINRALGRCRDSKIVKSNKKDRGIPQGTAISAIAANVFMYQFDLDAKALVSSFGGSYRRYSDDILILIPLAQQHVAMQKILEIAEQNRLTISPDKTEISRFSISGTEQVADRPISYLGFCFDGQKTFLRPSTLSRYYRRMTYAARGAARGAGKKGSPVSQTFKRSLFSDFTHLGKRNFYTYSRRADQKMPNSIIRRQLRRHFEILLRKIEKRGK
jgi:hypothetical protein